MTTDHGERRRLALLRFGGLAGLVVALGAAGVMLVQRPVTPSPTGGGPASAGAHPVREPVGLPGTLADSTPYTPLFFVDADRSVGTAPSPDGGQVRLVLRESGVERVLRALPREQSPEFGGFATDGTALVWLEVTTGTGDQDGSSIWTADLASAASRVLTGDTGQVVLFDAEHDLLLREGTVSWVSIPGSEDPESELPRTEIRTVALSGGEPAVRTVDGAWGLSAWPWLVTASLGDQGSVELLDLDTGERRAVPIQAAELVSCTPAWCRSVIINEADSSKVISLMRSDGSGRFVTASGQINSAVADVAVLDRYEIFSRKGKTGNELVVYDLTSRQGVAVAQGVARVAARNGVVWWSTGDGDSVSDYLILSELVRRSGWGRGRVVAGPKSAVWQRAGVALTWWKPVRWWWGFRWSCAGPDAATRG